MSVPVTAVKPWMSMSAIAGGIVIGLLLRMTLVFIAAHFAMRTLAMAFAISASGGGAIGALMGAMPTNLVGARAIRVRLAIVGLAAALGALATAATIDMGNSSAQKQVNERWLDEMALHIGFAVAGAAIARGLIYSLTYVRGDNSHAYRWSRTKKDGSP